MNNITIRIFAVLSVAMLSMPFVSFAIPLPRDSSIWPVPLFFGNELHELGQANRVGVDGLTGVQEEERYAQVGDDFLKDRVRWAKEKAKRQKADQEKWEAEAERRRAEEEEERRAQEKRSEQMKPRGTAPTTPIIQLGIMDMGDPEALRVTARYFNQFVDSRGALRPRSGLSINPQENFLTDIMERYTARAKKQGKQPLPNGFLTFFTTPTSFRLQTGNRGYILFDSQLAAGLSDGPRFGNLKNFQSDYVPPGKETMSPPNSRGPGIEPRQPQPPVTFFPQGMRSNQSDVGWTVVLPLELIIPQLTNLTWKTKMYASLHGSRISPSNPAPDIGFTMVFPEKSIDPKHVYTIIYSDLPHTNTPVGKSGFSSDMLFYVAEVQRFEKGLMRRPHALVELKEFLETLQKDGIVKLFYGRDRKINHVEWLLR